MIFKPDIDKVRQRLYAFWEGEYTGRACVSVVAPKYEGANISMFHNDRDMSNDAEALKDYWENPEVIYQNNINITPTIVIATPKNPLFESFSLFII